MNIKCRCIVCNKKFFRVSYEVKKNGGKFCSNKCRGQFGSTIKKVKCTICDKQVLRWPSVLKTKKPICSKECRKKFMSICVKGAKNPNWKGGKNNSSHGYILIYYPNHPRAVTRNYIYEHILVMEEHLGRYLKSKEYIHHINGKKDDNRLKNLYLCSHKEHLRIHSGWQLIKEKWYKHCPRCKKFLELNTDNFHKGNNIHDWKTKCKQCRYETELKFRYKDPTKSKYYKDFGSTTLERKDLIPKEFGSVVR